MSDFSIHRGQVHHAWDRTFKPVATLAPGDEAVLEFQDASGGQLVAGSTSADLEELDFATLDPVTGPLYVTGAEPGDALVVDILDVQVGEWGWTACLPGFGLLADDFPDPYLRVSTIAGGYAELLPGLRVPVVPMIGTIGVAPPEPEWCRMSLPSPAQHVQGVPVSFRRSAESTRRMLQRLGGRLGRGPAGAWP